MYKTYLEKVGIVSMGVGVLLPERGKRSGGQSENFLFFFQGTVVPLPPPLICLLLNLQRLCML